MKINRTAIARTAVVTALAATGFAVTAVGSAQAQSYDNWGAMAISVSTGNTAYAIDYGSAASAEQAAVNSCGASDCKAVVNFANGCGAVAQAPDLSWGWGYGPSRSEAEYQAIVGAPGYGAKILAWACTTGHQ
jgi:hypothetical protein